MSAVPENITVRFYPRQNAWRRLFALWYFGILIGIGTVLGHTVLGFEQSWAHPLVSIATALACQMLLEWIDARARGRPLRFASIAEFANFLLPAWIAGNAVAFLVYPGERLAPIAFAAALSIGSKVLFRAPVGRDATQHVFNPSNIGISLTLLLFPSVGISPPYHFTENVFGVWDWIVPGVILATGIVIHALFTGRLPLCLAWVGGFVTQGLVRASLAGTPLVVPLVPMTSAAFVLFTLYMIPDPATTPLNPRRQVLFGLAVAAVYGVLQLLHVVFGLFFALAIVAALRGLGLYVVHARAGVPVLERGERVAHAG
jgi:hypothetical protein